MNLAVEISSYLSKTEKPMFVARFVIFFSVIAVAATVVAVGVVVALEPYPPSRQKQSGWSVPVWFRNFLKECVSLSSLKRISG